MKEDRSLFAFIVSLLMHGLFAWLLLSNIHFPHTSEKKDVTEIEILENQKTRYIIDAQKEKPEEKLKEKLKKEADFLSNVTQRVKEQARAKRGLKTRNALPQPQKAIPKFNYDPENQARITPPPTLRKMAIGSAEFAESVPGIKQGYFNSLNSDQLTYFTFYSRVNEQVGYRWVSLVKEFLFNLPQEQLERITQTNKRTVVEVLLDAQGNYFSSLIHNASGIQGLDESTYKAFRLASPFLNPPQGLVNKEDGLIHLYYEFNVVFDPLPMAGPNQF
jgi:hypothetical protein